MLQRLFVCARIDTFCCRCIKMKRKKRHKTPQKACWCIWSACLSFLFYFIFITLIILTSSSKENAENHKFSHSSRVRMTKAAFEKQSPSAVITGSAYISLHAKNAFGSIKLDIYLRGVKTKRKKEMKNLIMGRFWGGLCKATSSWIHLTAGGSGEISGDMLTRPGEDVRIFNGEIPVTYSFTQLQNK